MPSEKIVSAQYGTEFRHVDPDNEVVDYTDDTFVKVQWHRETGIDVGLTVMRDSDDEVDNDRLHIWIDREGLNALMRVLKKAGAQTFGHDEW